MTGTEKQVVWAETIRTNLISKIDALLNAGTSTSRKFTADLLDEYNELGIIELVKNQPKASWWIEHKSDSAEEILYKTFNQMRFGCIGKSKFQIDVIHPANRRQMYTIKTYDGKTTTEHDDRYKSLKSARESAAMLIKGNILNVTPYAGEYTTSSELYSVI